MARRYAPKKRRRLTPKQRDNRMRRAVELRTAGLSLRQIADRLAASHQTVANDLGRWDRERPNVAPLTVKDERQKLPRTGRNLTTDFDAPNAEVLPLRRSS